MPLIPKQEPPYYENENGTTIKEYIALLTQTNTNAPTATILKNTIGNIIWTYADVGIYRGTLTAAFPAAKTALFVGQGDFNNIWLTHLTRESDNIVYVSTVEYQGTTDDNWLLTNDVLIGTAVHIIVYP